MYAPDDLGTMLLRDLGSGMHRYSINCKLSGGVALSTGIRNNVTIIHGPVGCAFQQRIPVLRDLDARRVVCSNLNENDTIFGGDKKLAETIVTVERRYQPELITVLLTCATGIIGDDIQGVIEDVKGLVKADVIWADTSGFSHRDLKDSAERLLKDQAKGYRQPRCQRATLIQGCGQEELFCSLVDQLMEDPTENGGVNKKAAFYIMPTRWFGRWWRDYLREIRETFGAGEVLVDAIHFNNSSIEEIKRLPCHHLNLQGHGRWVSTMKERFGTEYIADRVQYYNSPFRDGIRDFYLDNARILGVEKEVERIVEKRLAQMEARLKPFRDVFEGKRLAVIKGWSHWGTPYLILSQIFNLGFDFVYLNLPYDHIYDWNIDRGIIDDHLGALKGVFADYGVNPEVRVEASIEEDIEALKSLRPDLVITSYELKWLPHSLGIPAYVPYTFSFYQGVAGAIMAAEEMYKEYSRPMEKRPAPIYARDNDDYGYDPQRYPTPCNMMAGVKVWEDVRHVR